MAFRKADRRTTNGHGRKIQGNQKSLQRSVGYQKKLIFGRYGEESLKAGAPQPPDKESFLSGGVLPPPGSVPFGYGSGGSGGSRFIWWENWRFKLSFSNGEWCRRWVFLWDPNNIFSSFLKGGYQ